MSNETELNATQWAAVIALLLAMLIPVAIGLAWWFKQRYAKAIVRLQASAATPASASATPEAAPATKANEHVPPLTLHLLPATELTALEGDATAPARRIRGRVLRVQFVLGLLYWIGIEIVIATGLTVYNNALQTEASETVSIWGTLLMSLPVVFVPPLLAWAMQAGTRQSTAAWIIGVGAVSVGVGLALIGMGWIAAAVTPLLLALLGLTMTAFLRPAVRGAGPPLIAAMIVAFLAFCVFAMIAIAMDSDSPDEGWGSWTEILGESAILVVVLAFCAWIGWRMLLRISRRYARKRFSELQLALGSYWGLMTLFSMASVMMIAFEEKTGPAAEWIALFIVLFWLAWRLIQRLGLRWAVRRAAPPLPPLLLLRVFKPSNRSEAFMDRFLARWRFAGPVWMIGGPDLAGALMEPDEFFSYLRRTLAERFIRDGTQIEERLAGLDGVRDPDGRFRVSELFCSNTTWRQAVLAMIERAGVILLDLREYTPSRAGTRYELQQLLHRAPLERVLLLTDEAGDAPQLKSAIDEIWQTVGCRSGQTVRIVQLQDESGAELDGLFRVAAQSAAQAA